MLGERRVPDGQRGNVLGGADLSASLERVDAGIEPVTLAAVLAGKGRRLAKPQGLQRTMPLSSAWDWVRTVVPGPFWRSSAFARSRLRSMRFSRLVTRPILEMRGTAARTQLFMNTETAPKNTMRRPTLPSRDHWFFSSQACNSSSWSIFAKVQPICQVPSGLGVTYIARANSTPAFS